MGWLWNQLALRNIFSVLAEVRLVSFSILILNNAASFNSIFEFPFENIERMLVALAAPAWLEVLPLAFINYRAVLVYFSLAR